MSGKLFTVIGTTYAIEACPRNVALLPCIKT